MGGKGRGGVGNWVLGQPSKTSHLDIRSHIIKIYGHITRIYVCSSRCRYVCVCACVVRKEEMVVVDREGRKGGRGDKQKMSK